MQIMGKDGRGKHLKKNQLVMAKARGKKIVRNHIATNTKNAK